MNTRPRHRVARPLAGSLLLALVALTACEQSPPDPAEAAARQIVGSAGQGGDATAAATWQAALEAWPREGNLAVLFGSPAVQARMDAWMMGQAPPQPLPDVGEPVMAKIRAFNDRLIALDGAWGSVPEPAKIRDMAVRGMRKTLWADARCAVAEQDVDRLVDVLVVMATLPRVSHAYDASVRGMIASFGLVDGLTWALRDATTPQYEIELDADQCARLKSAAAWIEQGDAFGAVDPDDPQRTSALSQYEADTRVRVREMLARHCS